MINKQSKKEQALLEKVGKYSLYSWVKKEITDDLFKEENNIDNFVLHIYREGRKERLFQVLKEKDGDEVKLKKAFRKEASSVVTSFLHEVRDALPHERILLTFNMVNSEGGEKRLVSNKHFLLVRFHNEDYIHEVHGPRTKHMILVNKVVNNIEEGPFKGECPYLYFAKHFVYSQLFAEMVKDNQLPFLLSACVDKGRIDYNKFQLIYKKRLEEETFLHGNGSWSKSQDLLILDNGLTHLFEGVNYLRYVLPDDLEKLSLLPGLGRTYYGVDHDSDGNPFIKLFLKKTSPEVSEISLINGINLTINDIDVTRLKDIIQEAKENIEEEFRLKEDEKMKRDVDKYLKPLEEVEEKESSPIEIESNGFNVEVEE